MIRQNCDTMGAGGEGMAAELLEMLDRFIGLEEKSCPNLRRGPPNTDC